MNTAEAISYLSGITIVRKMPKDNSYIPRVKNERNDIPSKLQLVYGVEIDPQDLSDLLENYGYKKSRKWANMSSILYYYQLISGTYIREVDSYIFQYRVYNAKNEYHKYILGNVIGSITHDGNKEIKDGITVIHPDPRIEIWTQEKAKLYVIPAPGVIQVERIRFIR